MLYAAMWYIEEDQFGLTCPANGIYGKYKEK